MGTPMTLCLGGCRRLPHLGEAEGHRVTVLHDAGRGHVQSHRSVHQPGPIRWARTPKLWARRRTWGQRAGHSQRGPAWGRSGGKMGLQKVTGFDSLRSLAGGGGDPE